MQDLIGLVGVVVILGIALAFSSNRKAINLRIVGAAFGLQVVVAALVLYWDRGQNAIKAMKDGVMAVLASWPMMPMTPIRTPSRSMMVCGGAKGCSVSL